MLSWIPWEKIRFIRKFISFSKFIKSLSPCFYQPSQDLLALLTMFQINGFPFAWIQSHVYAFTSTSFSHCIWLNDLQLTKPKPLILRKEATRLLIFVSSYTNSTYNSGFLRNKLLKSTLFHESTKAAQFLHWWLILVSVFKKLCSGNQPEY